MSGCHLSFVDNDSVLAQNGCVVNLWAPTSVSSVERTAKQITVSALFRSRKPLCLVEPILGDVFGQVWKFN